MKRNLLLGSSLLFSTLAVACADDPVPFPFVAPDADVETDVESDIEADVREPDTGTPDIPEPDPCTNGLLDEGEEAVDCGGECEPCPDVIECGDGVTEGDEECDDGNQVFGDGCSTICTEEFELIDAHIPGMQGGVLELLGGADHPVEISFSIDMPDCDECIGGVVLLQNGEAVSCAPGEMLPHQADEVFIHTPSGGETATYQIGAALVWTEVSTRDNCSALLDAFNEDPDKVGAVYEIGVVELVPYPEVFSFQTSTGFCVDMPGSQQADGAGFITWGCTGNDNQLFTSDAGGFAVLHSGKCLAIDNRGGEPYPEQLAQFPCREGGFQGFWPHWNGASYTLSTQLGTCVEVVFRGGDVYQVEHHECDEESEEQRFVFVEEERTVPTVAVGDALDGGVVGYVFQPGDPGYVSSEAHGLIVAAETGRDLSWNGPGNYDVDVATSPSIGAGRANTDAIVAAHSAQGFSGYAAEWANNLSSGGYNDWYMPSRDELVQLYQNRSAIGGFERGTYWTSSQVSNLEAYRVDFGSGTAFSSDKLVESRVRPIRTF